MGYLAEAALRTMSQSGVAIRRDLLSLSCTALAHPSTALADASLPTPPATRRKSPSCRQCCRERCRGEKRKTLEKWAFRRVCPSSFPPQDNSGAAERPLERLRLRGVRSAYLQGDGGLGMAPRVRRVGARSAACRGLLRRAQGGCAGGGEYDRISTQS